VDSLWQIDETLNPGFGEAQSGAVAAQPGWMGTRSPFLAQIAQILGDNSAPDAAFLMDSWTVGVTAASENYQRRQVELKRREHDRHTWNSFSFTPLFLTQVEPLAEVAWPLREVSAGQIPATDSRWVGRQTADEIEMVCPLTLESACQVLGVEVTSTQKQIRAAYRKMASRYHPDRLARSEAGEQKLASDRMAYLNDAYRLLCTRLDGR